MIVCEIGLNHCGDEKYCDQYIDTLVKCDIDAITFQVREKEYYEREEKKHLALSNNYYEKAIKKIRENNLKVGIAIAEKNQVEYFNGLEVDFFKVISKDIMNYPLLDELIKTGKPIFIATGLSDISEIKKAVDYVKNHENKLILIHTSLTHDIEKVNLKAINMLRSEFDVPVAFGSHSKNHNILYMVLGFEPSDIFFYVKGPNPKPHGDEEHAIELEKCSETVANLRELKKALGKDIKLRMDNKISKSNQKVANRGD